MHTFEAIAAGTVQYSFDNQRKIVKKSVGIRRFAGVRFPLPEGILSLNKFHTDLEILFNTGLSKLYSGFVPSLRMIPNSISLIQTHPFGSLA
jgi:hypothetical protein